MSFATISRKYGIKSQFAIALFPVAKIFLHAGSKTSRVKLGNSSKENLYLYIISIAGRRK